MEQSRVFVVSDSLMFGDGLASLLISEADVEVIGEETDINRAIEQIETLKPDVIIWGNTGTKREAQQEEIRLLRATRGIKFIRLTLQSNEMIVYQSARKMIRNLQDLVTAIKFKCVPVPKVYSPAFSNIDLDNKQVYKSL